MSETGRTVTALAGGQIPHTRLRGDTITRQTQAWATSTATEETTVENHGTKVEPGTRSGGVLAMAAVTVVCAAVVLVWLAQLPPGVTGHR